VKKWVKKYELILLEEFLFAKINLEKILTLPLILVYFISLFFAYCNESGTFLHAKS
jgi:hypothetical protein